MQLAAVDVAHVPVIRPETCAPEIEPGRGWGEPQAYATELAPVSEQHRTGNKVRAPIDKLPLNLSPRQDRGITPGEEASGVAEELRGHVRQTVIAGSFLNENQVGIDAQQVGKAVFVIGTVERNDSKGAPRKSCS